MLENQNHEEDGFVKCKSLKYAFSITLFLRLIAILVLLFFWIFSEVRFLFRSPDPCWHNPYTIVRAILFILFVVCYISYNCYIAVKNLRSTEFKLHLPLYLLLDVAMFFYQIINVKHLYMFKGNGEDLTANGTFSAFAVFLYYQLRCFFNVLWNILNWCWDIFYNCLYKHIPLDFIAVHNVRIAFIVALVCIPPSIIVLLHYYVNGKKA